MLLKLSKNGIIVNQRGIVGTDEELKDIQNIRQCLFIIESISFRILGDKSCIDVEDLGTLLNTIRLYISIVNKSDKYSKLLSKYVDIALLQSSVYIISSYDNINLIYSAVLIANEAVKDCEINLVDNW